MKKKKIGLYDNFYKLEIETNGLFIEYNWKYKKPNYPPHLTTTIWYSVPEL